MIELLNEMDRIVETFSNATDKFKTCKGKNCNARNGVGHSEECEKEHSDCVNKIPVKEIPPSCFDRAESAGRVFDNCRYIHACKDVKSICGNYPA